jgi:uncharacterized protein (TIGR03000 family)
MYSVVMMMVMSGAPEMPAFGGRGGRGCVGGHGCGGAVAASCYGGCTGAVVSHGCVGNACYGCVGHACYGCTGYACNGCHGGRGGLFSRLRNHGCRGGHACHGCYGGNACYGCAGGHGCVGGCVGGHACVGGHGCVGGVVVHTASAAVVSEMPATVTVSLPVNAKLFFDGAATQATGATRTFTTPGLAAGVEHTYTVTAELDGKKSAAKVIKVRAGETTAISLTEADFGAVVAAK